MKHIHSVQNDILKYKTHTVQTLEHAYKFILVVGTWLTFGTVWKITLKIVPPWNPLRPSWRSTSTQHISMNLQSVFNCRKLLYYIILYYVILYILLEEHLLKFIQYWLFIITYSNIDTCSHNSHIRKRTPTCSYICCYVNMQPDVTFKFTCAPLVLTAKPFKRSLGVTIWMWGGGNCVRCKNFHFI